MANRTYAVEVSSLSGEFWWYVAALNIRSHGTYANYSEALRAGWKFCEERLK
jgi:hypothetical protein